MDRVFDRIALFDEKSRDFPATAGIEDKPLRSYTWRCDAWNDQGREGACVGFAWSHELTARPVVIKADNNLATTIYKRAQVLDQWPGEAYSGTSVLAGAKSVMELLNSKGQAHMAEYRWAFGIEDVLRTLGYKGPLVLGINWYRGMFVTDASGYIRVDGDRLGGHAILARGVKIIKLDNSRPATFDNIDLDKSYVLLRNSWGQDWGVNGDCKISVRDLDRLLREDGDACIPVIRKK